MTSRHRGLRKIEDITPRKSTVMQSLLSFANDAGTRPRQWILGRLFRRDAESPSRTGVTRETRALPGITVIARFLAR